MSRLPFAPKLEKIEIVDIKGGIGIFTPKPNAPVSFDALKKALKRAGYKLAAAEITVSGTLARDVDGSWWIVSEPTNQRFALEGEKLLPLLERAGTGARVEVVGDWKTAGVASKSREVVAPRIFRKGDASTVLSASAASPSEIHSVSSPSSIHAPFRTASFERPLAATASEEEEGIEALPDAAAMTAATTSASTEAASLAPVRTTSPGLTVYKGGAFVPRFLYTRQRLGDLRVSRQTLLLSATYTPTPTLQLEAEVPFSRLSFVSGTARGSGAGFGNIALHGKYRFYRTVERWGDRQAALRFGVELPTGKASAPDERQLGAPAYVRQQLTPISGGFAAVVDVSYSQARGRLIFGANAEGTLRAQRGGYRTGHEFRLNTDLEYVVFPFKYRRPTGELFAILETTYTQRGRGRVGGVEVAESRATEFYVAPALQYVATPRLILETSVQVPVRLDTGSQVLRTRGNLLLGIRYLF